MQPQYQPLNTFQSGRPATSTYPNDPSLPVQVARYPQDNPSSLLTSSRPLSFAPSVDHVTAKHPQAEQISEPRSIAKSPDIGPGTGGAGRKTQPSVLGGESDKFTPSSEEPRLPDRSLGLPREAVEPSSHDRYSDLPQQEVQEEEQTNPVVIGDAAPIFLEETAQAESYVGSPKEVYSPQSAASSNRTPTQADFPGLRRSSDLRSSQVATTGSEEVPPVPTHGGHHTSQEREMGRMVPQGYRDPGTTPQSSGIRIVSAAIAHDGLGQSTSRSDDLTTLDIAGSSGASTNAWPPPNTRVEQPSSTSDFADTDNMFRTTESRRMTDAVPPQNVNRHSTPQDFVQMGFQDPAYGSTGGANTTSVPVRQGFATIAAAANEQPRRPFSFMEYSSKEPSHPSRDFMLREPSLDSLPDEVHPDRPPSPVSPPRSLMQNNSDEYNELPPAQYDPDRDIIPVEDRSTPPNRHRSFSRPFKSPDIAQHPAYRQDQDLQPLTEATDLPTHYYPAQIRREEAFLPRQQGTEYQLEGVGPPPPVELTRSKSRSRRTSRSSGFFKNLGNSSKADIPPIPTDVERQGATPPIPSSTSTAPPTDKKAKRTSLFRSLTGHGSGSDRSKESVTAQARGSRTDLLQQSQPKDPSADSEDFPTRGKSKKLRGKHANNPSAGATEPESGKKKRFSALGVSLASRGGTTIKANVS